MKNSFLLLILTLISTAGCTVVVSDPHPHYVVREINYNGSRQPEVYYYGGYYYYAPCDHVHSSYYHTRVRHYNSHTMRVVTYHRPVNTVVIKESAHSHPHNTVIIKEQAPQRNNTVIIKEQAPQRNNTVIIKEQAPQRNNTVIIKEKENSKSNPPPSKSNNKVIIKK